MKRIDSLTRTPRALPVALGTALGVLCLVAAAGGCRSMTTLKEKQILDDLAKREQAVVEQEKALKVAEEKKAEDDRRRSERTEKREEAARRLAAGDAAGALEALDALTSPSTVVRKDAASGKEERLVVDAPALDPAERVEVLVLRGGALKETGKRDEALAAFQEAVKLDPKCRPARRSLGKVLFELKKYRPALDAWAPELADGYRDAELLSLEGQARVEVGRAEKSLSELEAARLAFEGVLVERPRDAEVQRWLATIAYETGRYEEAARRTAAILEESPLDPEYLELAGNCYLQLHDSKNALDYLELAASLRAPTPELAKSLSDLSRAQGHTGRAAEWLAHAFKNNPREAPAEERYAAGALFADAGRADEAIAWLGALREGEASFADAQSRLVSLYRDAGKADEAIAAYEAVKRTRPMDGEAHVAAGTLYLKRKQLDQAADAFSRASSIIATKSSGLAGLAEVSYAKRNLDAAILYYQKALELKPGDARLIAAIEQLAKERG
jgi:tetratricopeptide (TPR) repeat protein